MYDLYKPVMKPNKKWKSRILFLVISTSLFVVCSVIFSFIWNSLYVEAKDFFGVIPFRYPYDVILIGCLYGCMFTGIYNGIHHFRNIIIRLSNKVKILLTIFFVFTLAAIYVGGLLSFIPYYIYNIVQIIKQITKK